MSADHRAKPGLTVFAIAAPLLCIFAADDAGFRDSGEIGAAAHVLGVAHPTGFCVDLLVLKLAELLPLGHLAFRQNIAVALEAALVLGLVAHLTATVSRRVGAESDADVWAGVVISVCGLATWTTFLETALSVEVYTLALLAVVFAGCMALKSGRAASACCVILGLSPGLHVTAGLYTLLIGVVALAVDPHRHRWVRAGLPAVLAGALCLTYLPLAAHRKPALDWGDPTTLSRMFDHLSAARIRQAFRAEMWRADTDTGSALLDQFAPMATLVPMLAFALVLARRRRMLCIAIFGIAVVDLLYALRVNPMGIADRQVGHLAGTAVAVLAGVGASLACLMLGMRRRGFVWIGRIAAFGLAVLQVGRLDRSVLRDGYAASELLGSGGTLSELPARSTVVCWSDDACATVSFALYAEGVRPDMALVPAQHLWDPTIRRRLGPHSPIARFVGEPAPDRRARVSREVLSALLTASDRPIRLESHEPIVAAKIPAPVLATMTPPWKRLARIADVDAGQLEHALERLDLLRAARFPGLGPRAQRARAAWSIAYDELAAAGLGTRVAVDASLRATSLAPERASAFTNLGVALERVGDVNGAIAAMLRAIQLEPKRPTPWVNLARIQLARGDRAGAQTTLTTAQGLGVSDPRLAAVATSLRSVQH